MTLRNPRQVIADYIWNEVDVLDLDDMGAKFGKDIIDRLDAAGWVIVPKSGIEQEPKR